MGTAWAHNLSYPWEPSSPSPYTSGIETVKVNIMLRIYSNQSHVYAGLAILNPFAREQIGQYARSTTELFKLMVKGEEEALKERVKKARDRVFGGQVDGRKPILLSQEMLDRFSLSGLSSPPSSQPSPQNSHLSLLAMVDCWSVLHINPFHHLSLAATPIFRLFLGVAEYLFLTPSLLDNAIIAAIHDNTFRSDDLEFVVAARGWAECVRGEKTDVFTERFESTKGYFEGRFEEAAIKGGEMIKAIMESASGEGEGQE
jgi:prephenate dehydrogenase (NADP+)